MSLRQLSIWAITSCPGQNRRRSWHDLRLFADQPWFKRLSPEDILKKIDRKSISGFHYEPHEWTLKPFQSCLLFGYSRARHMWFAASMAHSLEPTVARIGAITLLSSRTTVVRRRWTPSRPWHSMVKIHFSSTQLSCFGKVMPSQGDRGSRVRGCHCIKWVACHFARLCWLVMTRYTSPFLSSKSRQERSPGMSMPLGYVQWMLLSESWWCHDLHLIRDQNLVTCCLSSQYKDSYELISKIACHRGFECRSEAPMSTLDS